MARPKLHTPAAKSLAPPAAGRQRRGGARLPAPVFALLLLLLGLDGAGGCTSLLVGRGATADGSLLLARSDDGSDALSDTNNLVFHPARAAPALWRSNLNALQVGGRGGAG